MVKTILEPQTDYNKGFKPLVIVSAVMSATLWV